VSVLLWGPFLGGFFYLAAAFSNPGPFSLLRDRVAGSHGDAEGTEGTEVTALSTDPQGPDPRNESQAQRDDRNLAELLQELRISGLGVQVLFGFLLSLPFTVRFTRLSHGQRDLYLASLVLSAVATALLLGPVAYHRLVFRHHQKEPLIRAASVMATLGLAAVGLAISAAVLLASSTVATGLPAILITIFVVLLFGGLWFAFPYTRRHRG
jgi:hypothetical protein